MRLLRVLVVTSIAAIAQTHPDLSGIWELKKSPGSPSDLWIKIAREPVGYTVTFRSSQDGKIEENANRFVPGEETTGTIHGAPMTSRSAWDRDTLVVESTAMSGGQPLVMNHRYRLSDDGSTLTFTDRNQFGSDKPSERTRIFERRSEASWKEHASSKTAAEVYQNIQRLKTLPASQLTPMMTEFSQSLGVVCTYCHAAGDFPSDEKTTKVVARKMIEMTDIINRSFTNPNEVTCWTCHRGRTTLEAGPPSNPAIWPIELNLTGPQGASPAAKVYKNLKFLNSTAADVRTAMLFMSASLGVGCSTCHVMGAWEKDDKPPKQIARTMLAMVRDTRREFTDTRIGCPTCHHGALKPEMAAGPK